MNERIKELAREAFIKERKEFCADWKESELSEALLEDFQVVFEKFAELIIQECVDILNPDNDLTSMREEYGRKMCMRLIKEHFGVEE